MADGQIIIDINADPAEFRRALDRLRSDTRSAAGSMSDALSRVGSSVAGIGDALTVGVTAPLGAGAVAVGKWSLESIGAAEQVDIAFGTMLGPKEGKAMLEDLYDFAATTPFEVSGLSSATQKMLAYGFSAEEIIPLLTSVGDATAGLGAGQEGIDAVTRAMGQMQAKGKVMSEEMLQLTEVGIPAWQYLADAITGGDIPAAMEEVTYGFVSADTAIAALQAGMDRDFGGMMSKQASTLTGILSNMSDAAYKAVIQAKDTEGYDELTDAMSELSGEIGPFVESLMPVFEDVLSAAADVARGAAGAMEDFSLMSEEGRRGVVGMIAGAAGLGPTMSVAGRAMQAAGAMAGGLGTGLGAVRTAAGKAKSGAQALGKTVSDASTMFGFARESGMGMSQALLEASAQAGDTAKSTGLLEGALGGLRGGMIGIASVGIVALLAATAAAIADTEEKARLAEQSTMRLSEVTAEASTSLEQASSSAEPAAEGYRQVAADVDELVAKQAQLAEQSAETWSGALADAALADQYRDTIVALADQTDLTAEQQAELKAAVEGFNDVCGTSISVIDPLNGKLSEQVDVVNQVADAYANQARQAAAMEIMQGYAEQQIQLEMEMRDAQQALAEAQQKVNEASEVGGTLWQQASDDMAAAQAEVDRLNEEYAACSDNIDYMTQVMSESAEQAGSTSDELAAYVETTRGLGEAMAQTGVDSAGLMAAMEQLGVSTSDLAALTDEQLIALASSYDGTLTSVEEKLTEFSGTAGTEGSQAGANFASGLSGQAQAALEAASQVSGVTTDELAAAAGEAGLSGDDAAVAFANGVKAGKSPSQAAADAVGDAAIARFDAAAGSMWSSGNHAGSNFANGLRAAIGAARDAANAVANAVAGVLGHSVPKEGPLRVGGKGEAAWGEHAGENFATGLAASAPAVARAAASSVSGMVRAMDRASALGWSAPAASYGAYGSRADGYAAMAASIDALGSRIDAMSDRLEAALARPSRLNVNGREFGRLMREEMATWTR